MKDCQQATDRIALGRARGALGAQQRDPLLQIQQLHGALPQGRAYVMTTAEVEAIPVTEDTEG